ncbi:hypothetical protein [Novosphingobium gossypii]|uniref:hypothetical protein n=1 Tax=Novosphingobium gossypii TaxID=1604774 RepID=UPI003D1F5F90
MSQPVTLDCVNDCDIERALAHIPPFGWPVDEEELVALFSRMLQALYSSAQKIARQ